MEPIRRRTALGLALALWSRAEEQAHQHAAPPSNPLAYRFAFFSRAEIATVRSYAAVLIPASERSGGAAAARVEEYMDHVLRNAAPSLQRNWRRGLAAWAKEKDPRAVFDRAAGQEFAPKSAADQFFVQFKSAATAAFYTSEEGITKELGYQGLGFLREFRGWEGETFQTPSDYRPRLRARS